MSRNIRFQRPDGASAEAYLAQAEQPLGALVVIQEWWGLNDQVRGVAQRFAKAGFTALVPDLYRGKSTVEAEEAEHLKSDLDFADAASQDIRGALLHLKGLKLGGGKVGITGFCMGGALTWLAAQQSPEADAAVVWYGMPPVQAIDAARLKLPIQAHWAEQDEFFPIDQVDALEARLQAAGVRYEGHRYLARHAFANETAQGPGRIPQTQYDAAWAQQAWDRTLRFLGQHLC
ncbi:dienelactone hydrolase family protein [Pelomonas sp. P7]|uniref:Dienelactone hydrolase family protein n=1 Tax=Pelomonas caseinilytica TaxID=2906763 RepID=A0ABS8XMD0_9BURK|nr:dienelactone hydrolase family protein [Pelomonas sp. P7]MCE4540228.1 dienelactone hydrolase family protein [Pelomonas sp. P7]